MQDDAAQQLHIEMTLPERSLGSLSDRRERLHKQIIDRLAAIQTLPQPRRARAQFIVAHCLELWLECVDRDDVSFSPFEIVRWRCRTAAERLLRTFMILEVARDLDRARADRIGQT